MRKRTGTSLESLCLINLKKGKSFYSSKPDKNITSLANYYKVKVKTQRVHAFDAHNPKEITGITLVTIISKDNE